MVLITLCSDHGGALCDSPQCLAQVSAATHEGDLVVVLVDVVGIVCWCEHLPTATTP